MQNKYSYQGFKTLNIDLNFTPRFHIFSPAFKYWFGVIVHLACVLMPLFALDKCSILKQSRKANNFGMAKAIVYTVVTVMVDPVI